MKRGRRLGAGEDRFRWRPAAGSDLPSSSAAVVKEGLHDALETDIGEYLMGCRSTTTPDHHCRSAALSRQSGLLSCQTDIDTSEDVTLEDLLAYQHELFTIASLTVFR